MLARFAARQPLAAGLARQCFFGTQTMSKNTHHAPGQPTTVASAAATSAADAASTAAPTSRIAVAQMCSGDDPQRNYRTVEGFAQVNVG